MHRGGSVGEPLGSHEELALPQSRQGHHQDMSIWSRADPRSKCTEPWGLQSLGLSEPLISSQLNVISSGLTTPTPAVKKPLLVSFENEQKPGDLV